MELHMYTLISLSIVIKNGKLVAMRYLTY